MRDHTTRRPMPVEQSILWKPLHDAHYVVASLQARDGGRRKIFVRQQALAAAMAHVRSHGRRTIGLLLGQFYECSVSNTEYLVVESTADLQVVSDEYEMAAAVGECLVARGTTHHGHIFGVDHTQVLGWIRGVSAVEAKPSLTTAAVHSSLFAQPWHVTLTLGEPANPGGAFFLRDTVNSRWFYAPFYEVLASSPAAHQPKPTVINWPQYLTVDSVVPAAVDQFLDKQSSEGRTKSYNKPELVRTSEGKERGARSSPPKKVADIPVVLSPQPADVRPTEQPPLADAAPIEEPSRVDLADTPVERSVSSDQAIPERPTAHATSESVAETRRNVRERGTRRFGSSADKLSIVDDRDQRSVPPSTRRQIKDDDDTTAGDDAGRYVEIARTEGFFVAARFDTPADSLRAETMWILNEPYSGLLLSVVSSGSEVIDATLHYNLQTDDAGLKKASFPEHRDAESKTVYIRETCVDGLRARCRRLRAMNSLLKEWKVTPTISFLTPADWEAIPVTDAKTVGGVAIAAEINNARIAELPQGLRSQFHIGTVGEANA